MFAIIERALTSVFARATETATNEDGQTMVEYGLILALVSIAAIAAVTLLGPALTGAFTQVADAITP